MTGAGLFVVLAMARVTALWDRPIAWSPAAIAGYVWQDILVALVFGAIAAALARWRWGRRASAALYWAIVFYAAINVPVIRVLSTPLTWPMLRAARGALADSIVSYVTWPHAGAIALVIVSAALISHLVRRPLSIRARLLWLGPALLVVMIGPVVTATIDTIGLHRNPLVALVASARPRVEARLTERDWTAPLFDAPAGDARADLRGLAAGRHVVLVGLESTAAQYLRLYGGTDDLTPRLDALAQHAVVFDHAYAVSPESIRGLFSVLCSRYPAFDTPPEAYASAPCESMATVLAETGYRTAMFHSGRFGYLGMNAVVRGRGFETLEDAGDIGGERESSFGVDEPATVARILAWIDGLASGERFFLTYLPVAGHHPYATPGRGPFPDDDEMGRYRNAVRWGDESLGVLIDGLRARGLHERTLWIVYGDHGEAFGQHEGNHGHTFFLYDENVRVPFLVAAPGAIDGPARNRTIVSLLDTAPTVLDLLGLPGRATYQGHSALDGRSRMALFFTDYSLSLVGLRDGRWKFVHDLTTSRSTLFDLERDPAERVNVASHQRVRVEAYVRVLDDWSAAQKALMRGD